MSTLFLSYSSSSFRNFSKFATRDLIHSCYASNSSNSCLPDERYRAAEFIAADPLNDGIPPCTIPEMAPRKPYLSKFRLI